LKPEQNRRVGAMLVIVGVVALDAILRRHQELLCSIVRVLVTRCFDAPGGPFSEQAAEELDYDRDDAWCALPGKASEAEFVPDGEVAIPDGDRTVDCFYVHPTGYYGSLWNEPVGHAPSDRHLRLWMLPTQASVFNRSCRIFSPVYRQATIHAFLLSRASGRAALDLAFSDVKRAFANFLNRIDGRPFVVAGHSQGSHHLLRLLVECVDAEPSVAKRLVCAYVVGVRVPLEAVASLRHLHVSRSADDINCIVGWDTQSPTYLGKHFFYMQQSPGHALGTDAWHCSTVSAPILSTNPLTWSPLTDEGTWLGMCTEVLEPSWQPSIKTFLADFTLPHRAVAITRKDAVDAARFYAIATSSGLVVPHLPTRSVGIAGALMVTGWYHCLDYALFYFNVRANVARRVDSFFRQDTLAGR
jgi:hypothetical protein